MAPQKAEREVSGEPQPEDERRKAIRMIMATLRSPILMLSKPHRDDMAILASGFGITAKDLLDYALFDARNR